MTTTKSSKIVRLTIKVCSADNYYIGSISLITTEDNIQKVRDKYEAEGIVTRGYEVEEFKEAVDAGALYNASAILATVVSIDFTIKNEVPEEVVSAEYPAI